MSRMTRQELAEENETLRSTLEQTQGLISDALGYDDADDAEDAEDSEEGSDSDDE